MRCTMSQFFSGKKNNEPIVLAKLPLHVHILCFPILFANCHVYFWENCLILKQYIIYLMFWTKVVTVWQRHYYSKIVLNNDCSRSILMWKISTSLVGHWLSTLSTDNTLHMANGWTYQELFYTDIGTALEQRLETEFISRVTICAFFQPA
jgi:hypothetical protein